MAAITIRDVPENVRQVLAARAARDGKSLQKYLRELLIVYAAKPTVDEVLTRARARVDATGTRLGIETIRAAKEIDKR
jgi:plasmid stability protein